MGLRGESVSLNVDHNSFTEQKKRAPIPEPGLLLGVDSFPSCVHYIEYRSY